MDIYEKYKIHVINSRRYYEYNVDKKLPLLDNTIPYYFKYNDIEIYDNRWTMMALKIVQALDAHQGMRGIMIGVQIKISEWSVIRSLNLRENFGLTPTIFYV